MSQTEKKTGSQPMMQKQLQKEAKQQEAPQVKPTSAAQKGFSFSVEANAAEDDFMRTLRSQTYMDIVASIDLLSATDEEIIEKLKENVDEEVLEEFAEMTAEEILEELRLAFEEEMAGRAVKLQALPEPVKMLGVICKCYIDGCDVHAIDNKGNILQHFKFGCHMPGPEWETARALYHSNEGKCHSIEIYSNCCRVVSGDGSSRKFFYGDMQ